MGRYYRLEALLAPRKLPCSYQLPVLSIVSIGSTLTTSFQSKQKASAKWSSHDHCHVIGLHGMRQLRVTGSAKTWKRVEAERGLSWVVIAFILIPGTCLCFCLILFLMQVKLYSRKVSELRFLLVYCISWWGSIFYMIVGELKLLLCSEGTEKAILDDWTFSLSLFPFLLVVCLVYQNLIIWKCPASVIVMSMSILKQVLPIYLKRFFYNDT